MDRNARIRLTAMEWCADLRARWGDHVPASALKTFLFEGEAIHLRGQQGIFKPRQLTDGPLSIRSALESPYNDEVLGGGSEIRYDYAPPTREAENTGLKHLARSATPLIYLIQVAPRSHGVEYLVVSPVFVKSWNDAARTFAISLSGRGTLPEVSGEVVPLVPEGIITQEYRLQQVRARLHQAGFRKLVLAAYRQRCSVCELRVRPLLDAAHIVSDSRGGKPEIQNGLGLCALHHRAMDRGIMSVLPDYTIQIDRDGIADSDKRAKSVLLDHHGQRLVLPKDEGHWPDRGLLEQALTA